ncbi:MAG TPA: response regulator [Thermodesulfobacteriota bacterium]
MADEKIKILITDDDLDLRELLTEAIKGWGYEVAIAKDGDEALRKLRMDHFHMVITDLMMPGMDGLVLQQKIMELDKDILVIIITGYATIETAVRAIESGAYDYIAKPFRLDELMIVIKNACERLRLKLQNRALLDELRRAYGEIAVLQKALGGGLALAAEEDGAEEDGAHEDGGDAMKEGVNPHRHQEYLKEADRFSRKPLQKI